MTVNRDVAELRSALGKAVQWGFLDVHPLARMKPVKTHAEPIVRWLSEDEEMRLRAALEFSRGAGFGPHVFARNPTAKKSIRASVAHLAHRDERADQRNTR